MCFDRATRLSPNLCVKVAAAISKKESTPFHFYPSFSLSLFLYSTQRPSPAPADDAWIAFLFLFLFSLATAATMCRAGACLTYLFDRAVSRVNTHLKHSHYKTESKTIAKHAQQLPSQSQLYPLPFALFQQFRHSTFQDIQASWLH
jgi:hypothetical protein